MWTVNSTNGLSYSLPIHIEEEEYIVQKRFMVRGFRGIMLGSDIEEVEIPYECPQVCSTGSGLINISDYE